MKVRELCSEVGKVKRKNQLKESKGSFNGVLSAMFNAIENFEKNGEADSKHNRDRIDVLKNLISNMMKDEAQKQIIKGGA